MKACNHVIPHNMLSFSDIPLRGYPCYGVGDPNTFIIKMSSKVKMISEVKMTYKVKMPSKMKKTTILA